MPRIVGRAFPSHPGAAGRVWGRGPELEGASERVPPPLRFFGRIETGERVLQASLRETSPLLGRHHPRTSPKRRSTKFATRKQRTCNSKDTLNGGYAAPSKPCKLPALANGAGV